MFSIEFLIAEEMGHKWLMVDGGSEGWGCCCWELYAGE